MTISLPTIPLKNGRRIPAMGLGTWQMGERQEAEREEIESLRRAIDLGMTVIDTAEMYGEGRSEMMVAKAIADRRDDVFLVSKIYPWNASFGGTIAACEASLRRLGTDRLDLYLLHWRGPELLADTVAAFEQLNTDGKIGGWGVSNFDTDDMEELYTVPDGDKCLVNQLLYNLSRRGIEYDLLPWCRDHDVAVMAYSPIEQGRLLQHPGLIDMAKAHQATPAQIALAFLLKQDGVMPIPKTANVERVAENRAAAELELTEADRRVLDALFPPPITKMPLDML
ncbi:aldo/keto reductase [Rhizobium halophytocola]|uniref:Diketogulonate reductase-like aldo/keto reductase n=1 Tax=Rhizobium halophytocola TaxID=735519 RepID=A0ABS4E6G3_9HYPH|nr:aldo/keto reductase [Rhizobium halophytocola]MBP1853493.1 diketogulonate reductase-like aldo/keto reductase [Rhizobium halophytocola]